MLKRLWQQTNALFRCAREQMQSNPLVSIVVIALLTLIGWVIWETSKLDNLGFGDRTLWNWMELLIVPMFLAGIAVWFNKRIRDTESEIASERLRDATLQTYLDKMTELLLEKNLHASDKKTEVRVVARARTLTVLRGLDGVRKGNLLRFLYESRLINRKDVVVDLHNADLREANLYQTCLSWSSLAGSNLAEANLVQAILQYADLQAAHLFMANLQWAQLQNANLDLANLCGCNLHGAKLWDATLPRANLNYADLSDADLSNADLNEAKLENVDLSGANLSGVNVTDKQLAQAKTLKDAIMPDGTKHA